MAQEKVSKSTEDKLPNTIHDTGSDGPKNHAEGKHSVVPDTIAQALPKKVEEAVPDAIHDTTGSKS